MSFDTSRIDDIQSFFLQYVRMPHWDRLVFLKAKIVEVQYEINTLADEVSFFNPFYCNELKRIGNHLFINNRLEPTTTSELMELLQVIKAETSKNNVWCFIHPRIVETSKALFEDGHYANAAQDAFVEINSRLKKIHRILVPNDTARDGQDLANYLFTPKNPLLQICDITDQTGKDTQQGLQFLFSGAIAAFRNPKAHENIRIDAEEAMRRLMFASLLMCKIDDAVAFGGITE